MIPKCILIGLAFWLGQNLTAQPLLRLSFVGDIMAHDSNYKMQDFSQIYQRIIPLLQKNELNFANLEFVIDNQRPFSTYPLFNVHTVYVDAAINAGFNIFSLANNHSTDFGLAGIRATEKSSYQFRQQYPNLAFSGLRAADKASNSFTMELIQHKGWNIGFIAISILTNSKKSIAGLQYIPSDDEKSLQKFYRWLAGKRTDYDLVIVSIHGGTEYKLEVSKQKTNIMRQVARHGADIVWGHHPHVQQPWEIYQGFTQELSQETSQGNERETVQRNWALIMYSQGNFISAQTIRTKPTAPQGFWAATGDSVLLEVEIGSSANGQLELRSLKPQLLTTVRLSPFAFAVVPMAEAAKAMRDQGYRGWDDFYAHRQSWLEKRVAKWSKKLLRR